MTKAKEALKSAHGEVLKLLLNPPARYVATAEQEYARALEAIRTNLEEALSALE